MRDVCESAYKARPDGLCGNDDCGQMSAWYVFSAMGFYPFSPCDGGYVLGAPQIPRVRLSLPGGRTLAICRDDGLEASEVRLNGVRRTAVTVSHAELLAGGELVFGGK